MAYQAMDGSKSMGTEGFMLLLLGERRPQPTNFVADLLATDGSSDVTYPLMMVSETQISPISAPRLWSPSFTQEVRNSLASFDEDWDAPGMELYDHL